jgi:alkaline phosphatase
MLRHSYIFVVLALLLAFVPTVAQEEAPPVLILPVDGAQFLPGVMFDLRVEVHTDALPDDFAVSVNGQPASDFFAAESVEESWEFGDEDAPTPAQSVIWRQLTLPAAGDYTVEVVAGGATHTATWTAREPLPGQGARNIILFVADGGQVGTFTAARLVSRGQTNGVYNSPLSFDTFEEIGFSHTSALNSIITDSAAGASAWLTGHKTAVAATGSYPDTSPDTFDDPRVETFTELIQRTRGMSVGVASDGDVTGATAAAMYGHARERDSEQRNVFVADHLDNGPFVDVILGGGARYFIPASTPGSRRTDERNLIEEYEAAGYTIVSTATELDAAMNGDEMPGQMLGLFTLGSLDSWLDREVFPENTGDFSDQPDLPTMTVAALEILNQNPNGFFLMVENDYIDSALHVMDMERMLASTIEFERSIAAAVEWTQANAPDTLIIVTADHGFGFDVYGTVDVEAFNAATTDTERRQAIEVEADAVPPSYVDEDGDFYPDTWEVDRTLAYSFGSFPDHTEDYQLSPEERVPAIPVDEDETVWIDNPEDDPNGIPLSGNLPPDGSDSFHSLQDVPIYATGPGADYFGRVMENREFFFGMARAIGLDPLAEDGMIAAE